MGLKAGQMTFKAPSTHKILKGRAKVVVMTPGLIAVPKEAEPA